MVLDLTDLTFSRVCKMWIGYLMILWSSMFLGAAGSTSLGFKPINSTWLVEIKMKLPLSPVYFAVLPLPICFSFMWPGEDFGIFLKICCRRRFSTDWEIWAGESAFSKL